MQVQYNIQTYKHFDTVLIMGIFGIFFVIPGRISNFKTGISGGPAQQSESENMCWSTTKSILQQPLEILNILTHALFLSNNFYMTSFFTN